MLYYNRTDLADISLKYAFTTVDPLIHVRLTARTGTTMQQLSQQQAALLLGYTQVSWDNKSGNEAQPASASKKWTDLTSQERFAATVLGYTQQTWITISQTKTLWSALTVWTGTGICTV